MIILFLGFAAHGGTNGNPILFIIGASLAIGGYNIGYGPIPYILSSEMVPTRIRGICMAYGLLTSYIAQLFTNITFLPMINYFNPSNVFLFYFLMNSITFLFVTYFLLETKDKSNKEILTDLSNNWNKIRGKKKHNVEVNFEFFNY